MTRSNLNVSLRPWMVVTLLCLLYCLAVIAANDNDPFALVTIGTRFSEGIPDGTEGYDGQFVYFIARDPSTAATFIANGKDFPAYRFQRILLPFLAMILSLGQNNLIPWVLLIINLGALAAGMMLLEHLLTQYGVRRWYALGYGLSLGVFGTVRLSLPETLAYTLVLGGIVLAKRDQWVWSAVIFALAALTKETTLLFVAGYGLYLLIHQRWQTMIMFGAIAGTPFLVWQIILRLKLGEFGVGSGGALATGFELIPFGGVFRILTAAIPDAQPSIPSAHYLIFQTETIFQPVAVLIFGIFLMLLAPFVLIPTLWALRQCWIELRKQKYDAVVLLLLVNAGIMLFVPFSTYREFLGILRFIVGLQIAVILYAAERKSRRALLNSTIWAITTAFLIASDFAN